MSTLNTLVRLHKVGRLSFIPQGTKVNIDCVSSSSMNSTVRNIPVWLLETSRMLCVLFKRLCVSYFRAKIVHCLLTNGTESEIHTRLHGHSLDETEWGKLEISNEKYINVSCSDVYCIYILQHFLLTSWLTMLSFQPKCPIAILWDSKSGFKQISFCPYRNQYGVVIVTFVYTPTVNYWNEICTNPGFQLE